MSMVSNLALAVWLDTWMLTESLHIASPIRRGLAHPEYVINILIHTSIPEIERLPNCGAVYIKKREILRSEQEPVTTSLSSPLVI